MAAPVEVLVTSENSGQLWNFCIWDIHSGSVLANYKGGSSSHRMLSCLAGEYFISAASNKTLIHVWATNRKDQHHLRIVCPGVVSSLAVTPDGFYCIAGIAEKIYVWQISTGLLLAVVSRHYQTVTCLRVTDDGSHFVSGGDDNLVMVWSLANILQEGQSSQGVDPLHTWSNHSLPITDLHCTTGGMMSRVMSASQDHTCKVYDMCSGELLSNFVFDAPIYSVCVDPAEYRLFAGAMNGTVYQVNLFAPNASRDRHINSSETGDGDESSSMFTGHRLGPGGPLCRLVPNLINIAKGRALEQGYSETGDGDESSSMFTGHSKPVTCLCVSMDGSMLVSGSQDQTVRIWHIQSKQCIRTINHKGAVTNALIIPSPANLQNNHTKPTHPIQVFKRHLHIPSLRDGMQNGSDRHAQTVAVRLKGMSVEVSKVSADGSNLTETDLDSMMTTINKEKSNTTGEVNIENLSARDLQQRLQQVQQQNKDIFTYAAKQILGSR